MCFAAKNSTLRIIKLLEELNPLSANPTKRSNTLKQFVGKLPANYLSVFDHFVILAFKGLIKKPNKDNSFTSNWRPISLLNLDLKMISKSLSTRVKKVISNLIDARQKRSVKAVV